MTPLSGLSGSVLVPTLVSFITTVVGIALIRPLATRGGFFVDEPNARSLHTGAIPRVGGLGIALGVAASSAWWVTPVLAPMLLTALALTTLGAADDASHVRAGLRLMVHLLAASLYGVLAFEMPSAALGVAVLAMVLATNFYNFMDGSDALAGLMAVIGFGTVALAIAPLGMTMASAASPGIVQNLTPAFALTGLCLAISASAAGFLFYNWPPARVFMGDAGSTALGFLAAAIGVAAHQHTLLPWWFVPAVFAPFWVDAVVTLLSRALRGEKVWQAHREHAYQKLVLAGMRKTRVASLALIAMFLCSASALVVLKAGRGESLLLLCHVLAWSSALTWAHRLTPKPQHPHTLS